MRTLFTLAFCSCLAFTAVAQSKKLVLVENFTNDACLPCARLAPSIDSLLTERLGEMVVLKIHGMYPNLSDKYYLNDIDNINQRIALYDVKGYPTVLVDGQVVANPYVETSELVDKRLKEQSPFDIAISSEMENGTVDVRVSAKALTDINNNNLRLYAVVMEEEIFLKRAPVNGEMHYYNTAQRFLPDGDGHPLPAQMSAGQIHDFAAQWEMQNFEDEKQLGIVAFVQDTLTKEVLQAAYMPRKAAKKDAASIIFARDIPSNICTPRFSTTIRLRNTGENTLTKATLNVEINGSTQRTPWQGRLEYLESATFQTEDFTDFTLDPYGNNDVLLYFTELNGTSATSDTCHTQIRHAATLRHQARLTVCTDKAPEEISWKLLNSAGETVEESEPYTEARHFYKKTLSIGTDDCYQIVFDDKGGDGIVGKNGNGYFKLEQIDAEGKAELIVRGDYTTAQHIVPFAMIDAKSGIDASTTSPQSITCLCEDNTITLECADESELRAALHDTTGKTMRSQTGKGRCEITTRGLSQGIYIIRASTDNGENIAQKVTVR